MRTQLGKYLLRPAFHVFAVAGVATGAFALALKAPLEKPPVMQSIQSGASQVDQTGIVPVSRVQARDGTQLGYRYFPAAQGTATEQIAILIHGSSGHSRAMTAVATALAGAGVSAVAVDIRGHGDSGTRGDIGFIGQLEEDMQDLVAELKRLHPDARFTLVGHSSGGGFALRIAADPTGDLFDKFVIVSPFLGYRAPTNRPTDENNRWAQPDLPRIVALLALNKLHIDALNGLPTLAFATKPGNEKFLTTQYSFRLMQNFGPPADFRAGFASIRRPTRLIIGEQDELFDAARFPAVIEGLGDKIAFSTVPGVDHMGMVRTAPALRAIVAAVTGDEK